MKRRVWQLLRVALALGVMILLILWMSGFFGAKIRSGTMPIEAQTATPQTEVATVEETAIPVVEEAAGTIQAERKTVVSSRILAVISDVLVNAGDPVQAGDTLIVLDDRELRSKLEEANRGVQAAAAARQRAASDFERARKLRATGVISQSEFDQVESTFKIADAELQRTRQASRAAEVALSYTRITAPVTGRVIDRLADPGDTAVPGTPLLSLYDPTALRIEVPVRESLVTRLAVGDRLAVHVGGEKETLQGRVDEIVPQAEAGSRTFLVKIGLPKREGLYTGMFGRVLIPAGERTRVVVPAAAIERMGQLDFAYVVEGGRLVRRLVTLGPAAGDGRVEVLSGLRPGEKVVARSPGA
jgi:membrane fusion protein (multidrug efflux system)